MELRVLAVGDIVGEGGQDILRRRLRELGLCDGAKVTCTFQGAHRDIAVYKICGAQIAVRDCDAQHVWVLAEVAE